MDPLPLPLPLPLPPLLWRRGGIYTYMTYIHLTYCRKHTYAYTVVEAQSVERIEGGSVKQYAVGEHLGVKA